MAEDIYPLGQGNGLMTDIANFALNNLYQYGQKSKEANQQLSQGMTDLSQGGNGDLLSSALQSARGVSPLYTGTVNWAGMAPDAIAALKKFGTRFPAMLGAAEAAPQNITSEVTTNMPSMAGGLLRKPTPEEHLMRFRPGYENNPYTVGHEIQHSLNAGRVAGTDPLDALTIGTLLRDVLPSSYRGSLDTVLGAQLQAPTLMQRIGGMFGRPMPAPIVTNPDRGLMRAAMDEGLAYLGENAARGKGGPLVQTLADRMGVNWENPRLPSGSAGGGPDLAASYSKFRDLLPESQVKPLMDKLYNDYHEAYSSAGQRMGPPNYLQLLKQGNERLFGSAGQGPLTRDSFMADLLSKVKQAIGAAESPAYAPKFNFIRDVANYSDKATRLSPQELAATLETVSKRGLLEGIANKSLAQGVGNPALTQKNLNDIQAFLDEAIARGK